MSANPVTASTQFDSNPAAPKTQAQLLKLITFEIGKLSLAVRIEQVHKVVNLPTVHGSGLNPVGLARVDQREITVLDLHRRLFQAEAESAANHYLVLIKTQREEILGIPAIETPLLLDIPTNLIRKLPESYRRSDTLEIASHIAIVPVGEDQTRTLFLLDTERLTR
ncbi:MAG: chemotaxis protein CheW [Elainella sp.]